ncbi:hypothetical protein ElyMa_001081600 [Elysia marginata]|uniref:Sushi domain-containing protein n=1 Tax=Elysia marginata TaxID=1093978 RepID=A0AAV4HVZ4_9GAST|nr:hypothetical protein ElyMa_001081600 [Elysia marginata]
MGKRHKSRNYPAVSRTVTTGPAYHQQKDNITHVPKFQCRIEPLVYRTYHPKNFYHVEYFNNSTILFSCLTNYHLVSGNLRWDCLRNESWSGTEPLCEVDYLK